MSGMMTTMVMVMAMMGGNDNWKREPSIATIGAPKNWDEKSLVITDLGRPRGALHLQIFQSMSARKNVRKEKNG